MHPEVRLAVSGSLAELTLSNPGKFNAMTRSMWRGLRAAMDAVANSPELRCVVVRGATGHFCAGGDIAEYPSFRFDSSSLRQFHEDEVWAALRSMLQCDVVLVAGIEGNCMGAGLEIASCCDIRIAAQSARFGAPIARLGFPMAPREMQLVLGQVGASVARELLLEAATMDAQRLAQCGFLNRVVPDTEVEAHLRQSTGRICALAPNAARMTKRTLRSLQTTDSGAAGSLKQLVHGAYDYADSVEHREGVAAFLAKRPPAF